MISLSTQELFFVYLGLFLGCVLISWLLSELVRGIRKKQASEGLIRCRVCSLVYTASPDPSRPTRCPRCGLLNERDNFY